MRPPLKERTDVDALWAGIADGTVDVVESDHAPHTRADKESADPPAGMPGLETTIPLLGLGVREGRIDAERLDQLVTSGPQRVLGIEPPADTRTIVDLDASWVVDGRAAPERARLVAVRRDASLGPRPRGPHPWCGGLRR